jgi:hypothetical protein
VDAGDGTVDFTKNRSFKMISKRLLALAFVCAAATAGAQSTDTLKGMKKVEKNTKVAVDKGAKDTKNAVVKGAKDTKNATVTAGKDTKKAVKKIAGKDTTKKKP